MKTYKNLIDSCIIEEKENKKLKKERKATLRKCKKCAFFDTETGMCGSNHRLPKEHTKWKNYEKSVISNAFLRVGAQECVYFVTKKDSKACETRKNNLKKMERGYNERYRILEREENERLQKERKRALEEEIKRRKKEEKERHEQEKREIRTMIAEGRARCSDCAYLGKIKQREYKKDFSVEKEHYCCYREKEVRINDGLIPCDKFRLYRMLATEERQELSKRIELAKAQPSEKRKTICGDCVYFNTITEKVYVNGVAEKQKFSYCYAYSGEKLCNGLTECDRFLEKSSISREFEERLSLKRVYAERRRAEQRENEEKERLIKEEARRKEIERQEAEERERKAEEKRQRELLEAERKKKEEEERRIKEEKRREYESHLISLGLCKECIYFRKSKLSFEKDMCAKTGINSDLEKSRYDCSSFIQTAKVVSRSVSSPDSERGKCKDCFHIYTDEKGYYCFHRTCSLDYVDPNWGCDKFERKHYSFEANYGTRTSTNRKCRNCRHVLTDDDGWYCFHMTCREERVSPDKGCDKFESKF